MLMKAMEARKKAEVSIKVWCRLILFPLLPSNILILSFFKKKI